MEEEVKIVKYAFSTLGCPEWTTEQVADNAVRIGYNGVELRLIDNEVIDPIRDASKVRQAVEIYRSRDLEICAFDTSCKFNFHEETERTKNVEELRVWLQLAQELQVPIIRVFGGAGHDDHIATENQWVADALGQVAKQAEQAGVTVVLETHDGFASARRTASVLESINSPAIAALWDSHHPYRMGETAEEVWQLLGKRVAHVHVKDARPDATNPSGWKLVLIGEGEVPVREQLQCLYTHGYTGYISVEWEKRWHPEIAEPEIALPQHLTWLRSIEQSLTK
jgi:sugar phosphate isomerase/epimerase